MEEFYKLSRDAVFKSIFCKKGNERYLERLLYECLDREVKIISFKVPELPKDNIRVKTKVLDVLVKSNDEEINIEINTIMKDYVRRRNACYIFKEYCDSISISESYNNMKNFIQINLTSNLSNNYPDKCIYKLYDKDHDLVFIDNLEIYEFNISKIKKTCYNNSRKSLLAMLDMDKVELANYNGDDIIMEVREDLMDLNDDSEFVGFMRAEDEEKIWINTFKNEGREEGIKEGIKEGREETLNETVKKMLDENMDLELISKITGLSLNRIEELK